jgi:hypothetical protein
MYKDSQGDVWNAKTIKQVFTSEANQSSHDLFHEKEKVEGVNAISNYITDKEKVVGGRTVPVGSWIKELMITDEDIIEMIKSNQLNGVSPNFRLHANSTCIKEIQNIKGNLFYNKDIENKECMNPVFLSLVDEPANEYGLNVYSYDKYLEKSKNPGGKHMANKFKEMLKSFGESVVNYADNMDESESEETEEVELEKADETTEPAASTEEASTTEEVPAESAANENVVNEEDSFEAIQEKVSTAVQDKYFPGDDNGNKHWVNITLTFSDAVVVQDWDDDKYYKVSYSIDGDTVTLGELQEVEMQMVVKDGATTPTEPAATETTAAAESQKSKQPKIKMSKIRINETKLDDKELEKGNQEKKNHLGFPIKSTKELAARNSFKF